MDAASNEELDALTDIMFSAAVAGICFVLALFCVMTPFFLSSDVLSSLLLLGFFLATFGTFHFARESYQAEQRVQRLHAEALEELAALRSPTKAT